ncbi:MAG: outer membrane protein assembly factor BamD [Hymenobacteraceae bacterium]|nr:outer membrane protein assembly factor BamD [Hymenobacteraceae bacterium]
MPTRLFAVSRLLLNLSLLAALAVGAACSNFQKVLKSDSVDKKYEAAVKYYDTGKYEKSTIILEELLPLLRGRPEAEKAAYLFAQGEFLQRYYELSAFQFRVFTETYPRSPYAEEAAFLYTKSLYLSSPTFNLDQSSTVTALESIRDFQVRYPESKYRKEAQDMSDELTSKLEKKAFESARLYANVRFYQSAVVALTNFLREYPNSKFGEEAQFLRVEAEHELARQSVPEKQRERFLETAAFYQGFVDAYPSSKYLRAAEAAYTDAQRQLERLTKTPTPATAPEAKK